MAKKLPNGAFQMSDGRILYGNSIVLTADLLEILPLITPAPLWPMVSTGGGGGNAVIGEDGLQGNQGNQGPSSMFGGAQGASGNQGSQGFLGLQGAQGSQGMRGAQGAQGNQSNIGFQGVIGRQGFQGNQGRQGNQGNQGNLGFQSTDPGVQGPQGLAGEDGGPQGAQGPQGPQGNQGFRGFQDDAGFQGSQGMGLVGNQGNQGGADGWTDAGATVHLTTSTNDVVVGPNTALGKFTIIGDTAAQIMAVFRQAAAQTANVFQNQDSVGTVISDIQFDGRYDIFAGGIFPTTRLSSAVLAFGSGAGAVDAQIRRKAASQLTIVDSSGTATGQLVPNTDSEGNIGTSALRWLAMAAISFDSFTSTAHTFPTARITNGAIIFSSGAAGFDAKVARKAASQFTVLDGGTTTGDFVPNTDSEGNIGTSALRWLAMSSVKFDSYTSTAHSFPTARIASGAIVFSSGAAGIDAKVARKAASQITVLDGGTTTADFMPNTDSEGNIGTSALRWLTMSSVRFDSYASTAHSFPASRIISATLAFGPGTSPVDPQLKRKAAAQLTVTNSGTTTGDFVPNANGAGNVGTASLRWSLVRAVAVTPGDLNLESEDGKSSWTIREQPDRIHAINNKAGKKYKFKLREVEGSGQ